MGHPLYNNLREGNWLMDHTLARLKTQKVYGKLFDLLKSLFDAVLYISSLAVLASFID